MKKSSSLVGTGHYAEICPSHITNDEEIRKFLPSGALVMYFPETYQIDGEMVFLGVVLINQTPITASEKAKDIIAVPMAKLKFSENQFSEILTRYPDIYEHYRRIVADALGVGSQRISIKKIHHELKNSCRSAKTSMVLADIDESYEE